MRNHSPFDELCAAAAAGQASAEELLELERHAADCSACREAYERYLALAGQQYATAASEPGITDQTAKDSLQSYLLMERFVKRAHTEGIDFSKEATSDFRRSGSSAVPIFQRPSWSIPLKAVAAVLLVGFALVGANRYVRQPVRQNIASLQHEITIAAHSEQNALKNRIAQLDSQTADLQHQVEGLKAQLQSASNELAARDTDLKAGVEQRQQLASARDALQSQLLATQQQLSTSTAALTAARVQLASLPAKPDEVTATLVSDRVRINELSAKLEETTNALGQVKQLLAMHHDVTNLMAERDLHIVDVVDTDPRGNARRAFGRIFFTKGKSLIFYAYDLNEKKIENAKYQYHIWAKKEGPDPNVRSLGIFYSDNKAQRRWVFKCDDPKVLSEIDSVFVTLQPTDSKPKGPKGPDLMYAYLGGQPNHP